MAGHSHWKQIKNQKGTADKKRGQVFSKLLAAITVAARGESNSQFNARLRAAVLKAKENQVPQENIDRAISKASSQDENAEELTVEAYGPGGSALIIEAITSSSNRTMNELKQILNDHDAKLAPPGSASWAFDPPQGEVFEWRPKFPQTFDAAAKEKNEVLIADIENQADVQNVYTNIK